MASGTQTRSGTFSSNYQINHQTLITFILFSVPDIVDFDLTKDGDVCNSTELQSLYQQSYFCSARKAVGLEKLFVMHMDAQWQTDRLACALSNNSIHLTTINTLTKLDTFLVHDQNIIDVHFSPVDPNCLYTGSNDGKIRTWDLRAAKKHVQEFKGFTILEKFRWNLY